MTWDSFRGMLLSPALTIYVEHNILLSPHDISNFVLPGIKLYVHILIQHLIHKVSTRTLSGAVSLAKSSKFDIILSDSSVITNFEDKNLSWVTLSKLSELLEDAL